jgi:hypothetical protein
MLHLKGLFPNEERNVQKAREYFRIAVRIKPSLSSVISLSLSLSHNYHNDTITHDHKSKQLFDFIYISLNEFIQDVPSEGVIQKLVHQQKHQNMYDLLLLSLHLSSLNSQMFIFLRFEITRQRIKQSKSLYNIIWAVDDVQFLT